MDTIALLCAALGGFLVGSYPVLIKVPSVLEAKAHPVAFQCFKSFWVFVCSCLLILFRVITARQPIFVFSWWAVASAACWIPAGLCTITSVPLIGVGLNNIVACGMNSVLSFLVFWLVLGEDMKEHGSPGKGFFLAPVYLVCVILGMVGLVSAPHLFKAEDAHVPLEDECDRNQLGLHKCQHRDRKCDGPEERPAPITNEQDLVNLVGQSQSALDYEPKSIVVEAAEVADHNTKLLKGLTCALGTGVFSTVQFGLVNVARTVSESSEGCDKDSTSCSANLREQFNNFGSWMASFGIGAVLVSFVSICGLRLMVHLRSKPMPALALRVIRVPASAAGVCWFSGAFLQTAAIVRGGSAVMMPTTLASQLITAGAWGTFYYQEVRGWRAFFWSMAAVWTLVAMVLLAGEKEASQRN